MNDRLGIPETATIENSRRGTTSMTFLHPPQTIPSRKNLRLLHVHHCSRARSYALELVAALCSNLPFGSNAEALPIRGTLHIRRRLNGPSGSSDLHIRLSIALAVGLSRTALAGRFRNSGRFNGSPIGAR